LAGAIAVAKCEHTGQDVDKLEATVLEVWIWDASLGHCNEKGLRISSITRAIGQELVTIAVSSPESHYVDP
jgi:hypothetical protein